MKILQLTVADRKKKEIDSFCPKLMQGKQFTLHWFGVRHFWRSVYRLTVTAEQFQFNVIYLF